jgi:heme exporter protein B
VDRSAIYLGKMLGNVLFIAVVELIILPIFVVLFNLSAWDLPQLVGVMLLGTVGLAGVGTLFSAMAIHTRAREVLLPILLFPVVIPAILSAVKLTAAILDRWPWADAQNWFSLLVAFDVIFMALSLILFDYVVEE